MGQIGSSGTCPVLLAAAFALAGPAARAEDIALDTIDVSSPSPIAAPVRGGAGVGAGPSSAFPVGKLPVVTTTFSPVTVVTQGDIVRQQPRTLGDALFDGPAFPPPPTRRVRRAGRSSAASIPAGCGSRRTASASTTSRISARITRFRSTRRSPTASR